MDINRALYCPLLSLIFFPQAIQQRVALLGQQPAFCEGKPPRQSPTRCTNWHTVCQPVVIFLLRAKQKYALCLQTAPWLWSVRGTETLKYVISTIPDSSSGLFDSAILNLMVGLMTPGHHLNTLHKYSVTLRWGSFQKLNVSLLYSFQKKSFDKF